MPDLLFDSSFLIAYFNEMADGKAGVAQKFRASLPARSRFFVSVATLAELLEGAEEPETVESELIRFARLVGLHHQHARRAGIMQRKARACGRRMGENDAWIAATASLTGLILVGDDDNAFQDRPSVAYVNYRNRNPE